MKINVLSRTQLARRQVAALHCSGAGPGQWKTLGEQLGDGCELFAPEHYGCSAPWSGEHAFTLADEAARTIEWIERSDEKVHLVGHSYGGGVALHVALACPELIASLSLYEPSAFHLLRQMGERGSEAFAEILGVARGVSMGVVSGDYRGAIAEFVDYWNGPGSWNALRPQVQRALVRWAPKAPLDFRALIENPTPADAYRALRFPTLILRGEHAPLSTRTVVDGLSELLPACRVEVVDGAGHMGPLTHAAEVAQRIATHVAASDSEQRTARSASSFATRTRIDSQAEQVAA